MLTPNQQGLVYVAEKGKYPVIWTPNEEFTGDSVNVITETEELKGLVDYLQKLGTNRGKWRDRFEPQQIEASMVSIPRSEEWIEFGQEVYQRRCEGCHGDKGDGNGPAATFMYEFRPRNFTAGVFKFSLTPSGSLPQDGDLWRTITRGVRGSAMPSWHMLPDKDRIAVIQYIKYELAVDRSEPDEPYAISQRNLLKHQYILDRRLIPLKKLWHMARKSGSRQNAGNAMEIPGKEMVKRLQDLKTI